MADETSPRERRLNEILAEMLEATDRSRQRLSQWLDRYPDFEKEISEFIKDYDRAAALFQELPVAHAIGKSLKFLDDYEVLDQVGKTPSSVVYKAYQKSLRKTVALKTVRTDRQTNSDERERLNVEGWALGRLNHPNIVTVYARWDFEGQCFLSMEFVDGGTLSDAIKKGGVTPTNAASYMISVALAVHYAHEQGVLHRDLKPSNILIDAHGRAKVADFGLAKLMEEDLLHPNEGILGTPPYMAPEQVQGSPATRQSDVYGLGAVLYELLTERPPFKGRTVRETLLMVRDEPLEPPRLSKPSTPEPLGAVCLKSLEKDPDKRYQSAHELAEDLRRFLDGEPVRALLPEPVVWSRYWRVLHRRTDARTLGLAAGPVIGLLVAWSSSTALPALGNQMFESEAMAGIAALMAVWWVTEAIPVAATALLPLVLFPLAGIMPAASVSALFADDVVFLFLGGMLIGLALEETGLPRRMALRIIEVFGGRPEIVVLAVMCATAAISMWVANAAAALIMLPVAVSVTSQAHSEYAPEDTKNFRKAVMLAVAYGATTGGMATLVGTPANQVALRYSSDLGFLRWLAIGFPCAAALTGAGWALLVFHAFPIRDRRLFGGPQTVARESHAKTALTHAERRICVVAAITAILWIFRRPVAGWGWAPALGLGEEVTDGTIAMAMALVCFMIPSGNESGDRLLNWRAAARVPWTVFFLFGGGMALAGGVKASGLDVQLGRWLAIMLRGAPRFELLVALVFAAGFGAFAFTWRRYRKHRRAPAECYSVAPVIVSLAAPTVAIAVLLYAREEGMRLLSAIAAAAGLTQVFTTNLAIAETLLPALSETGRELSIDPTALLVAATLAVSCDFMLPISTPPNAIVFATGKLTVRDMLRAGVWLSVVGVVIVALFVSLAVH